MLYMSILVQLQKYVLIKVFKKLLNLLRVDRHRKPVRTKWGIQNWIHIQIMKQYCGTNRWLIVQPGTTVSVTTSSNFEVKGTVYSILFGSKYSCQMLSHGIICIISDFYDLLLPLIPQKRCLKMYEFYSIRASNVTQGLVTKCISSLYMNDIYFWFNSFVYVTTKVVPTYMLHTCNVL